MKNRNSDILGKLGFALLFILLFTCLMVGVTYYQLQELEKTTPQKNKGSKNKRDFETHLEEMLRKMEKEE